MKRSKMAFQTILAGCATLLAVATSGCASLTANGGTGTLASLADQPAAAAQAEEPAASVTLELRADKGTPERTTVPLEAGMTVQSTLEKSGAIKRFRRMNVRVMRATGNRRAKLNVEYDHGHRSVSPLYDYALHPGDHIVVEEDTTTALDDMLSSVLSPLGLNQRR